MFCLNTFLSNWLDFTKTIIYFTKTIIPNGLWVNSPFGLWPPGLLTQSPFEELLLWYSWPFSCYSMPIHRLVHGHMTADKETVSCQMLWVGNIAKTMTSNGKQFTVTCEMLTAVAVIRACSWRWPDVDAGISAHFSKFAFVLFCCITNHLMTGPLGNSEFCFLKSQCFPQLQRTLRF